MRSRVLALDGERDVLDTLVGVLESSGFDVETAADGAGGFQKILDRKFDVIIADLAILEVKDFEFLKGVVTVSPSTGIFALVTREKVHQAVKVLRHGVFDYLIKPVGFDEILLRLKRLREYTQLTAETRRLRKEVHREYGFGNIVGASESMGKTLQTVRQVTPTSDPVLLTGRSGSGKELFARVIHFNGPRSDKPFIVVNCSAFVESLFESALFGHTDGSFARTLPETEGLFEAAEGGTLFLDEVSEVPLHLQARLFHAMEGKESAPDRSTVPKCTDVRLIAATNKDLRSAVESGLFQEGLYRRLIANEIRLPSLSERIEDIPALAEHFVEKYRRVLKKSVKGITPEALRILQAYPWRGEVRELENAIERALIFCEGEFIDAPDLPADIRVGAKEEPEFRGSTLKEVIREFEKRYITEQLILHRGSREETARTLKIGLSSLYRKIDELGIVDS